MYNYKKHLMWAKVKVGLTVTVALLVLFITVMFAGNISEFFSPRVRIYAIFDDVKGLRDGAPVWFSGIEIGSVRSLDFQPEQKIRGTFLIKPDSLMYLKKDSYATILTLGMLGDKYVEISTGSKESEALKPGDTIKGFSQLEFQDIVATSEESIGRISEFITAFRSLILRIEQGEGTISKFMKDPGIYDDLKETTERLSMLVDNLEKGKGSLGRLLHEDSIYLDISSSVEDVKMFARSLRESEGTVYRLINDPALYDRFKGAAESIDTFSRRVATSRGTVNRLIEDESLYENINTLSERLNLLLERIDRGEGLLGSLVRDDKLAEELKVTLKELNLLVKDIKKNPKKYFNISIF